jgi:magnesium transporter
MPDLTDSLIVVNRFDMYLGTLSLTQLLTSDPSLTVAEIMDREVEPIPASMPAREVASLFEKRDLISAPVVNESNRLMGRITIDDVVDVIRDEADHSLLSMAGLHEEDDMFAPVIASARRRALWLGINLITVFLAAWVVGLFQETLHKVVALAVLMPISASMGGIAGTQTLTLMIRGLALGHIGKTNSRWLFFKEVAVGSLNGVVWAIAVAMIAYFWFGDYMLGVFIAAAMLINLIVAALAGFSIPLILRRFGIDPALAGSVVLTTVTDVIGYLSFLGLATLFLM